MDQQAGSRVTIRDIDMPFTSMVRFMVKWALASIPAFLILFLIGVALVTATGALGAVWSTSRPWTDSETRLSSGAAHSTHASGSAAEEAYVLNVVISGLHVRPGALDDTGVFGEVKNGGARTLREVELTIYFLGADGKPIFEKKAYPVLVSEFSFGDANQPLKPGYSRTFGINADGAPSGWSGRVSARVTAVHFAD